MKILIDIPDNAYEWINEHKGVTDFKTTEMLYNRVRNGIPLNGTNGDVIKAVFENMTSKVTDEGWIAVKKDRLQLGTDLRASDSWWNAEYKGAE